MSQIDCYLGEIQVFAGNFAPEGWAFCEGQLLSVLEYPDLFSLLGNRFGGDGIQNFALPDLRGRRVVHPGGAQGARLGETGGQTSVALSRSHLPEHVHRLNCSSLAGTQAGPQGAVPAAGPGYDARPVSTLDSRAVGQTGEGQAFPVAQPFLTVHYIIALTGEFPRF